MTHRYTLYSSNNEPRPIRTKETGLVIRPGDRLVLESGGGGGWGDPDKRTAEGRSRDIESGFVTSPHPNPPQLAGDGGLHRDRIPSPASGGGLGWGHCAR